MASPAQVLTNLQNAQRSTGPRSAEGKRRSSLNAVRHGLTSQLVVLPGEDHAPYESFRANLLAELAPQGVVETMLAQSVCDSQWRLERARAAEANILALAHYVALPAAIEEIPDPAHRAAIVEAYAATLYERSLRNVQIQESRLQRALFKTLDELRKLQLARKESEKSQMTQAINAREHHLAQNLPFNPADFGFVFTTTQIDRELHCRHMQASPLTPFRPRKSVPNQRPSTGLFS